MDFVLELLILLGYHQLTIHWIVECITSLHMIPVDWPKIQVGWKLYVKA
jgi:hypothetical protein